MKNNWKVTEDFVKWHPTPGNEITRILEEHKSETSTLSSIKQEGYSLK